MYGLFQGKTCSVKYIQYSQLVVMKVCVFFIYKMTLLGKSWEVVSSQHITLIEANVCVFLCLCGHVCVQEEQLCLRERTSDKATGPLAGNSRAKHRHKTAEGKSQKGDIALPVTPTQTLFHCLSIRY